MMGRSRNVIPPTLLEIASTAETVNPFILLGQATR
jgi:hypothetical protein